MNSLLRVLEANEPTINAAVGLLTLAAAGWGFMQLALIPLLKGRATQNAQPSGKASPSKLRQLWISLIDRGVDTRSDLIAQVAGRTLNACLMVVTGVTLVLLIIALIEDETAMSVANLLMFLAAITSYNLHAAGYRTTAQWLLIISVTLVWVCNILMMGTMIGLEYGLGGVLMLPLLIFDKNQKKQLYGASLIIVLSLPFAVAAESQLKNLWPFNSVSVPTGYYYVNAVVLACFVFLALYFYNRSADASFRRLEDQQQKSSELIHKLLPAYIAEKVAQRGPAVADWHSEASVLFATVLGFDSLYRRVSAVQIVEILRQIFEEFDELVDAHGVEKINTLGTHYVAAAGIDAMGNGSCEQLARVALDMQEVVKRVGVTLDHPFGLRVGISTGDVLSGVIGEARPSFDIWGKTVELANAMRDDAESNTIVVNEAAYWRLKGLFDFSEQRGEDTAFLLLKEATRARGS